MTSDCWREQYEALVPRLTGFARAMPLTLCGLATCTGAYLRLADVEPLFTARNGKAASLARTLQQRAVSGIGGELFVHWPEAEDWMAENLRPSSWGLGGTGAQAAGLASGDVITDVAGHRVPSPAVRHKPHTRNLPTT